MTAGNQYKNPYEGEGVRRMFRGATEPDYSTRRIAAVCLWDSNNAIQGSMSLPVRFLEGVESVRDILGHVLWVELVYPNESSASSDFLGIASIEVASWVGGIVVPDYFDSNETGN